MADEANSHVATTCASPESAKYKRHGPLTDVKVLPTHVGAIFNRAIRLNSHYGTPFNRRKVPFTHVDTTFT
jgi:hypothetical protein